MQRPCAQAADLVGGDDPDVIGWALAVRFPAMWITLTALAYEPAVRGLQMIGVFEVALRRLSAVAIEDILLLAEAPRRR